MRIFSRTQAKPAEPEQPEQPKKPVFRLTVSINDKPFIVSNGAFEVTYEPYKGLYTIKIEDEAHALIKELMQENG